MQSTMVPLNAPPGAGTVVVAMPEHPPDYAVWSICNAMYANPFCLGLIAFNYSMKSRDQKMLGNMNGARSYGSKACLANGFALGFTIITIIILMVLLFGSNKSTYQNPYYRGY
ncbi:interferon-induced transmembrane protein 3-like [Neoarius graeffei]|uniref:interferon-induced transmembrane protein 3-like n=1 Tax=Neoarius graeffei TaxID=443677 RepID=UPI00298C720A|nr:interferon-induced transmembrane protein 3-like [Neoarius graeffei]